MNQSKYLDLWATGLAIFAMFFGAGNIIFPLAIGHYALDKTPFAIMGLLLTAVAMPFAGLLAMFLYQGDTRAFFGRIGQIPGLILAFIIIALLGPLGSTPRCIALAYSTFQTSYPFLSPTLFSLGACALVFLAVYKKSRLLSLLGYILTPILIFSLVFIIIKGLIEAPTARPSMLVDSNASLFWHGLQEGYNTMDLLAAFFFAPVIIQSIRAKEGKQTQARLAKFVLQASAIGACLLAGVYIGFSYLASFYAPHVGDVTSDQLLASIALHILGSQAGLLVNIIVSLACLTTAIALISAFCQFVQQDLLHTQRHEKLILFLSLSVTFVVANFEFQGISVFLAPVLQLCYPALIALTILNMGWKLFEFKPVKGPLLACFTAAIFFTYFYN